jgi:hypothetical protein
VQRAFEADMRQMERLLRGIRADLVQFQDIRQLKRSLESYSLDPFDDDGWSLGPEEFRPRPRKRRRR